MDPYGPSVKSGSASALTSHICDIDPVRPSPAAEEPPVPDEAERDEAAQVGPFPYALDLLVHATHDLEIRSRGLALAVLIILAKNAMGSGLCWRASRTLAKELQADRGAVRDAIKLLVNRGYLRKQRSADPKRRCNEYILPIDPVLRVMGRPTADGLGQPRVGPIDPLRGGHSHPSEGRAATPEGGATATPEGGLQPPQKGGYSHPRRGATATPKRGIKREIEKRSENSRARDDFHPRVLTAEDPSDRSIPGDRMTPDAPQSKRPYPPDPGTPAPSNLLRIEDLPPRPARTTPRWIAGKGLVS
jgi:hypothetical protein